MTRRRKNSFKPKKLSSEKLKSKVLKQFINKPKKRYNAKLLIHKLKLSNSKDAIQHVLNVLNQEGLIFHLGEKMYRLDRDFKSQMSLQTNAQKYTGKVDLIKSGAAYILVDELEEDIYVSSKNVNGAMHGDTVEVVITKKPWKRKAEGKIKHILKRAVKQIIGTYRQFGKNGIVISQMKRMDIDVHIHPDHINGAIDGQRVVAQITQYGQSQNKAFWGKVVEKYKKISHNDFTMNSILLENGFTVDFPEEVNNESEAISAVISEQEISLRRDMRDVLTFTIDPDTAKDFDDAISFQYLENGNMEMGVHIADVTHFVKPGSAIDKEAYERSTSVYLVDRVAPMLPEKLSNNLCSLVPHEDRLVFSAIFEIDKDFKIVSEWFGKSVIHSDRRFTYEEAQEIIENKQGEYSKEILRLKRFAEHLRKEKFKNGAINFESPELKFELDENSVPISVYVKERKDAHMLIEDFMLLANRRVAGYIKEKSPTEIPFVYRIHDIPDPEKLANFNAYARELGVPLQLDTPSNIAKSFNTLQKKSESDDALKLLLPMAIRTMSKAEYSTNNIGHYGLSFLNYAHFTSPIRRYADVLVHRILFANLSGVSREDKELLEARCKHISNRERNANDAERDSVKYKQVEFLKDKVGQEFEGMISGIIDRGVFVELSDCKAEGLIGFDKFDEAFEIVAERLKAKGQRTGRMLKIGQTLRVKLIDANLDDRIIELELLDEE